MTRNRAHGCRAGLAAIVVLASGIAYGYVPLAFRMVEEDGDRIAYLYWEQVQNGEPIPFSISSAGTPDITLSPGDPEIDELEAIALAFETWRVAAGGEIDFEIALTDTETYGYDGENVVFFADLGDVSYGGVTLITYENTTGRLLDVDIHLNDHDIRWLTSRNGPDGEPLACPCAGVDPQAEFVNDVQGLTTHEIGHALGLDHSAVGRRESATTPTMYPRGIWNVPGDFNLPPNSRYRTLELDDLAGLRALVGGNPAHGPAEVRGEVYDRFDRPAFGAHVVARNLSTGEEIGALSGMLAGPFDPGAYAIEWIPPGSYELRVEPLVGAPPGLVGPWNFGGIVAGVLPSSFPEEIELQTTYHPFASQPSEATPIELGLDELAVADFRPPALLERLPRFARRPLPFKIEGHVNTAVLPDLRKATLTVARDGVPQMIPVPVDGSPFSIPVAPVAPGTLLEIGIRLTSADGTHHKAQLHRMQLGVSQEPLLVASLVGGQRFVAVDSRTMFDFERTERILSFPLAQVFHRGRYAVYGTEFGWDAVSVVRLSRRAADPTSPRPWDDDGDGLLDVLEPVFGTDALDADTDGDGDFDGLEISQLLYDDPAAGAAAFEVIGAALPAGGSEPLGRLGYIAVWNETQQVWATPTLTLPPSGRFRLFLAPGPTYRLSAWSDVDLFATQTPLFASAPGAVHAIGAVILPLPPPSHPLPDTGSDPLRAIDGVGLFRPDVRRIALPPGADPSALALDRQERFLYVTGFGTRELYKIDTMTDRLVDSVALDGAGPLGVAVSLDGSRVYVANHFSSTLSVVRASDLTPLDLIELGGRPNHIRVLDRQDRAVISVDGKEDLLLLDTETGSLIGSVSTGLLGTVYLHAQPTQGGLVLAGNYDLGSHALALLRLETDEVQTLDLGPEIAGTAGVALHPNGERAWAIHVANPQILELDTSNGQILRRLDLPYIDTRDLLVINGSRPLPLQTTRPLPPPPVSPFGSKPPTPAGR